MDKHYRTSILVCFFAGIAMFSSNLQAQFTRADTLRGALRPERTAYDVVHYRLDLKLQPADSSISGEVQIAYRGVFQQQVIQLDLDKNLALLSATQSGKNLATRRVDDAIFVTLSRPTQAGKMDTIKVAYAGKPISAINPPWDGGVTWTKDSLNRPWVGVSCEGIGASKWWPTKDHLSDEPDSVLFVMSAPNPMRVISNGRLRKTIPGLSETRFEYAVTYPINNYNISFYAGNYLTFTDTLQSKAHETPLLLNYAALDYNLARANQHFKQVKPMLRCYENILGPYPFWNDGYGLIEAPYLGMEHQSGIAYGNNYMRGYRGGMIPSDMNWDYLIIHESGHEYFGNALSVSDHAEMWLHESFTTYLEALYVECLYGKEDYQRYLDGQLKFISNKYPILGVTGVNFDAFGSSDHYFKGSWVLHTFRSLVGDEAFLSFLKQFYQEHAIGTVSTEDWTSAVAKTFGVDFQAFWTQYLTQPSIPKLRVEVSGANDLQTVAYFEGVIPGFNMELSLAGRRISLSDTPKLVELSKKDWLALERGRYLLDYSGLTFE